MCHFEKQNSSFFRRAPRRAARMFSPGPAVALDVRVYFALRPAGRTNGSDKSGASRTAGQSAAGADRSASVPAERGAVESAERFRSTSRPRSAAVPAAGQLVRRVVG